MTKSDARKMNTIDRYPLLLKIRVIILRNVVRNNKWGLFYGAHGNTAPLQQFVGCVFYACKGAL